MLRQRIVTAVVLLAILLPAMWASRPEPFALLTLLFVAAAAWEWARLSGLSAWAGAGFGVLLAAAGLLAWRAGWTEQAPRRPGPHWPGPRRLPA